jgi:GTPase Era involved in 16S rRNA processing
MVNVRKLLLIGRTGNGKSTIANVLSETNVFKESTHSVSETREIKTADFEVDLIGGVSEKVIYRVIDTIGIGDTRLEPREVLNRIAEACCEIGDGLNQILFVVRGKFTEEEMEAYNLLRSTIFDKDIVNYTTIVRTDFSHFEDEEECEEDRKKIAEESPKLAELIRSCNKLIYVDNPSISTGKIRRDNINEETREESRKKLLEHLIINCGNYRPVGLNRLQERIGSYMTEKEKLQKQLRDSQNLAQKNEE